MLRPQGDSKAPAIDRESQGNTARSCESERVETPKRDGSRGGNGATSDEALKVAIVAAVEAGLWDRARALIDLLSRER